MAIGDNVLPADRATKIAQSDKWTAAQRLMVIGGVPILMAISGTFGGLILGETIQNGKDVAGHTQKIDSIDENVKALKVRGDADHDHLSAIDGVILVINTKLEQLPLLWSAIGRSRNPAPVDPKP